MLEFENDAAGAAARHSEKLAQYSAFRTKFESAILPEFDQAQQQADVLTSQRKLAAQQLEDAKQAFSHAYEAADGNASAPTVIAAQDAKERASAAFDEISAQASTAAAEVSHLELQSAVFIAAMRALRRDALAAFHAMRREQLLNDHAQAVAQALAFDYLEQSQADAHTGKASDDAPRAIAAALAARVEALATSAAMMQAMADESAAVIEPLDFGALAEAAAWDTGARYAASHRVAGGAADLTAGDNKAKAMFAQLETVPAP